MIPARSYWSLTAITLLVVACSSKKEDGPSDGCGLNVGGEPFELILACDQPAGGLLLAHTCTEYYSNVKDAVLPSVKSICTAFKGNEVARCPQEGSLGSCVNISTTGGGQGLASATYEYEEGGRTPAQARSACRGSYSPPGEPAASGAGSNSNVTSTCPATSPGGGGVAFSVATLLNGEVISCTNFLGEVTAQQLESVLRVGATTEACTETNARCACSMPGKGTFGTDAVQVYYDTSMSAKDESDCPSVQESCAGEFIAPYEAP